MVSKVNMGVCIRTCVKKLDDPLQSKSFYLSHTVGWARWSVFEWCFKSNKTGINNVDHKDIVFYKNLFYFFLKL